jgi:hypothetical protein
LWFVSEEATDEQFDAIRAVFAGEFGGRLADLFGEVMDVKRAPITHTTVQGKGALRIGDVVSGCCTTTR